MKSFAIIVMRFWVGTIVVAGLAAAAHAQSATLGDSAQGILGSWEFSNAGRDKVCMATFKDRRIAAGFKVEFDADCGNLFPLVRNVAAWVFPENDLLRLVDAQGKSLVEFSEVESGLYEAPTPGVGVLFLQSPNAPKPGDDEPPPPAESTPGR
jgi:hypothetical protein